MSLPNMVGLGIRKDLDLEEKKKLHQFFICYFFLIFMSFSRVRTCIKFERHNNHHLIGQH